MHACLVHTSKKKTKGQAGTLLRLHKQPASVFFECRICGLYYFYDTYRSEEVFRSYLTSDPSSFKPVPVSRCMKFNLFYFIALSVASADWTPDSFPNPWTNASGCGIPFKSWICDPDHLLNAKGYGSLQDGLVNLHQSLPVVKCPSSQLVGVLLNVLVVDEIDKKTACPGRMSNLQCLEK